jgi:hypothetical protein
MIRRKDIVSERYVNPRLTSGIEYVMSITANKPLYGQHSCGFIWYEPEFSLCKTKAFRKLYEARAMKLAQAVRRERGYELEISVSWNVRDELIIMTSVHA